MAKIVKQNITVRGNCHLCQHCVYSDEKRIRLPDNEEYVHVRCVRILVKSRPEAGSVSSSKMKRVMVDLCNRENPQKVSVYRDPRQWSMSHNREAVMHRNDADRVFRFWALRKIPVIHNPFGPQLLGRIVDSFLPKFTYNLYTKQGDQGRALITYRVSLSSNYGVEDWDMDWAVSWENYLYVFTNKRKVIRVSSRMNESLYDGILHINVCGGC